MERTPKRLYPNKRFKSNVNTPFKSPLIRKGKSSPNDSVVPTIGGSPPDNLDSTPVKFKIFQSKDDDNTIVSSTPTKKVDTSPFFQQKTPIKSLHLNTDKQQTPIKSTAPQTPSKEKRELEFKINQLKSALTFLKTDKDLVSLTEKWRSVCKSILVEYKPISEFCMYHSIDLQKFPDYDAESDDFI
ncbi:hypothetical protein HK103_006764 [Boothiomyces macroporosus]|uniref:Uncharacterized protein n=1 Tax=Boothiomyces macroporosus TaxID=261099 RepID=A0AAD5UD09_9FUNG|nr:hypothetical protein HK103_006764 [Boothiomyces macroporosus]